MGFKLADLYVSIEAQTQKFRQQMGSVRRAAMDTGQRVGDVDFGGAAGELADSVADLPPKIQQAFLPVAGMMAQTFAKAFGPMQAGTAKAGGEFSRLLDPIKKIGLGLIKAFRWDVIIHGLEGLKLLIVKFFADATGDAARFKIALLAALDLGVMTGRIGKFQHQLMNLISPSRLIGAAIAIPARAALLGLGKGVDAMFADATGRSAALGVALKSALDLGVMATRSQAFQRALGRALNPARQVGNAIRGAVSVLGKGVAAAGRFTGGLRASKAAATGLRDIMGQVVIASGFVAIGFKIVQFFKTAVTEASHMGETIDKVDAVLGSSAPAVKAYADRMAAEFGLVKRTTLDAASGFAGLAKGIGNLRGDKLSDFSIRMTQLSADFASFADIDFEDAQKSVKIGLTGEPSDVLKQFGAIVNDATTKQYALKHGIGRANGELTNQQKLEARSGLIVQQLSDANDNLNLTQVSTANRARKAGGQFMNLAASIGTVLLPVVNKALQVFGQLTSFISRCFEANKPAIEGFVDSMSYGFEVVASVFRNWRASFEVARLAIVQGLVNLGEYFDVLGPNVAIVGSYIARNWYALLKDGVNASLTLFQNFGKNISALGTAIGTFLADPTQGFKVDWTPLLDGFTSTAEKLPELLKPHLTDMSEAIAAAARPILEDIANRTRKIGGPNAPRGQAVDNPDGEKEAKKGSVVDLAGFANSIQEAVNGKAALAERQARAAERTAKAAEELVRQRANPQTAMVGGPAWGAAGMA